MFVNYQRVGSNPGFSGVLFVKSSEQGGIVVTALTVIQDLMTKTPAWVWIP